MGWIKLWIIKLGGGEGFVHILTHLYEPLGTSFIKTTSWRDWRGPWKKNKKFFIEFSSAKDPPPPRLHVSVHNKFIIYYIDNTKIVYLDRN